MADTKLLVPWSAVAAAEDLVPEDAELIAGFLPPAWTAKGAALEGLSNATLMQQPLPPALPAASGGKPRDRDLRARRTAAAAQLGLAELLVQLENVEPRGQGLSRVLLALVHVARRLPAPLLAAAMADATTGLALLSKLAVLHQRIAELPSLNAHLVVAALWSVAGASEATFHAPEYATDGMVVLDHMAGSPELLEVLLGHVVFAAVQPRDAMFTRRGLATTSRAVKVLFALQVRGLPHSRQVQQMCAAADLNGRITQVLGHPYQELMPPPEHPADAPKGQSTGELYTQLLGSAVTYLGYSSGIFTAPGGNMTLDAGKLVASGAWLMGPGRLEGIRFALDTLTLTLYSNALLDHVECPEIRHVDITLRNLLLTLALPLCTSKRQAEVVELATFSVRLFHTLHKLDFLPLFQRMLWASHPEEGMLPARHYRDGEFQGFFSTLAGIMIDAITTVGAATPTALTQPAGDDGGTTSANGSILQADPEQAPAAPPSEQELQAARAWVQAQLPRLIVWSDLLMAAVQQSQEQVFNGRAAPPYRPATRSPSPAEGAQGEGAPAGPQVARRCASCGARIPRLMSCQRCSVAVYCSRDCQVEHWSSSHKQQCKLLVAAGGGKPAGAAAAADQPQKQP